MKNCPACKTATLESQSLESHLAASKCLTCEGHWVMAEDYRSWLETGAQAEIATEPLSQVEDSTHAVFCPDCSQLMRKTNVGHDLDFSVDQCPSCQGAWLDRYEWSHLKSKNLHAQVHHMPSSAWQHKVRQYRLQSTVRQAFANRLSATDYSEAERIKKWLDFHPQKQELLSFFAASA